MQDFQIIISHSSQHDPTYHLSSTGTSTDSNWKSVETGAEPDYILVDSFSDNPDYSVLFDIDRISELMDRSEPSRDGDDTMKYIVTIIAAVALIAIAAFVLRRNH